MSFNWRNYISFASELCKRQDESALRSSISRAYYGAFCLSRNYLINESKIQQPRYEELGKIHKLVIDYLSDSDDADENTIGQYLDSLRKKRNLADYDGTYLVQNENFPKLLGNATRIVEIIDDISSSIV